MAITGIDTIDGKQIIAAGAVSAKSAEMAYKDENGNPITGYLTAVPEGYATTGDLNDLVTSISETYQPTAGMTAYQPAGDYYSASNPSGFISEVPTGTMNESAFGYDANDKISGYNGSAFAGGSDVSEGVMLESGLEYNAVNEISGYNGSAIAQYGAEKQWLVHDDTLVHLSNSAQFALGVNLSAVAQLLGVDETVLWSGSITWGQTAALSDSVKNYDRIRFYIEETNRHRKSTNELVLTDLSNANLREFALNMQDATTSYFGNYFTVYNVNEAGDSLTSVSGRQWWYSPWTAAGINGSQDRGLILTRVIGIGRKQ